MKSLYHRNAHGLPAIRLAVLTGLALSDHANQQIQARSIRADLTTFDPTLCRVFELETEDGQPVKVAYRRRYDAGRDFCAVVSLTSRRVLTVWLNRATDPHLTLNRAAYAKPGDRAA